MDAFFILLGLLAVAFLIFYYLIYIKVIKDEDGDLIPDIIELKAKDLKDSIEDKFEDFSNLIENVEDSIEEIVEDVKETIEEGKYRAERVKEEVGDVVEELKEAVEQVKDIPAAVQGKPRRGRPKKTK